MSCSLFPAHPWIILSNVQALWHDSFFAANERPFCHSVVYFMSNGNIWHHLIAHSYLTYKNITWLYFIDSSLRTLYFPIQKHSSIICQFVSGKITEKKMIKDRKPQIAELFITSKGENGGNWFDKILVSIVTQSEVNLSCHCTLYIFLSSTF